jgi:hypothetical protein
MPRPPQTLDDLPAQAEHHADHSLRNMKSAPPGLFLIGANGRSSSSRGQANLKGGGKAAGLIIPL